MMRVALAVRYAMLVGSLAALIGALLMFYEAGLKLAHGLRGAATPSAAGGHGIIASVMGATDASLFGIVLMIFAYSIAFGFVFEIPASLRERLPDWMRLRGVHELKHTLIQVVVVYLIVDFATDVAEAEQHLSWQSLVMPLAIVMIAGALRLMSEPPGNGHRE